MSDIDERRTFSKRHSIGVFEPQTDSLRPETRAAILDLILGLNRPYLTFPSNEVLANNVQRFFLLDPPAMVGQSGSSPETIVGGLVREGQWYDVFDLIEIVATSVHHTNGSSASRDLDHFTERLNTVFLEHHVGFVMQDGKVVPCDKDRVVLSSLHEG